VTIFKRDYYYSNSHWHPDHITSLIARNSGPYHSKYYENNWNEEDWKPSIPPFDYNIDWRADKIICNISLELSKCPEKPITAAVLIFLEKVGGQNGEKFPLGVFALNIETVCHCKCEKSIGDNFEKNSPRCNGGDLSCGICQNCPEGSFGESCKCSSDSQALKPLPEIEKQERKIT